VAYLALGPVSVGVYSALNVAGLTALVGTRIYDDLPQNPTYPCVWFEVTERDARGLGTGGLPEIDLRVHAFSTYEGQKEAQQILQKCVELLKDQTLTVAGYTFCGHIVYRDTQSVGYLDVNGVKVRELVGYFTCWVEE
jgi:hypothetical protein